MSETKTVETEYGTAEIEVVECDSCGNTIRKEQAKRFAIGERVPNPRINDAEVNGWACEYCMEKGPLSFPEKVKQWSMPKDDDGASIAIWFLTGILLIPIYTMSAFINNDEFDRGVAFATLTLMLYTAIFVGLYIGTAL